jgi:signal transduction histidine kinase
MLLFKATGFPSELLAFMICVLVSLILLSFEFFVFIFIIRHTQREKEVDWLRGSFFMAASDAMSQIARGDFSVFLDPKDFGEQHELINNINSMAKELGSIEILRQDFVSNVSHEIQSPLTSISGYATLLENDALDDAQRKNYLNVIKTESTRLSKLSSNLLKLSSLDSVVTPLINRSFRLDKQLQNAVILLDPQWSGKNISVTAELDKVTVAADEELLSQIWINLLHNAIKFTSEGGAIHITLTQNCGKAVCTITDNGMGISAEEQIHIFERFYRVDKSRARALGGNGLGLSLVKKIAELHGGAVSVKSEKGKGTTFTVSL